MRLLRALGLALLVASASALYTKKDDVELLTEANFDETVLQSADHWLIEFFAPVRPAERLPRACAYPQGVARASAVAATRKGVARASTRCGRIFLADTCS